MSRTSDWAEMATAVMAYVGAYRGEGLFEVLEVLDGYSKAMNSCPSDDDSEPLSEPWPGLSDAQRAAMVALIAGPRLAPEVAGSCGWSAGTTGSVLAALRRRGLAVEVAGLWSRV